MTKIKVEFGFGSGLDCDGKAIPFSSAKKGVDAIRNTALRLFGGYTRYRTNGGWKDESDGKVFVEDGSTLVVFTDPDDGPEKINQLVAVIKFALQQRAVWVTKTLVETDLM